MASRFYVNYNVCNNKWNKNKFNDRDPNNPSDQSEIKRRRCDWNTLKQERRKIISPAEYLVNQEEELAAQVLNVIPILKNRAFAICMSGVFDKYIPFISIRNIVYDMTLSLRNWLLGSIAYKAVFEQKKTTANFDLPCDTQSVCPKNTICCQGFCKGISSCPKSKIGEWCKSSGDCEESGLVGLGKNSAVVCCKPDGTSHAVGTIQGWGRCTVPKINAGVGWCPNDPIAPKGYEVRLGEECKASTDCLGWGGIGKGSHCCAGGKCRKDAGVGSICNNSDNCCGRACAQPITGGGAGSMKCAFGTWYGMKKFPEGDTSPATCCRVGGNQNRGGLHVAGLEKNAWGEVVSRRTNGVNWGDCRRRKGDISKWSDTSLNLSIGEVYGAELEKVCW